ncbi:2-oxoacid:acceptor oxidoreductase family protein [Garciella nitratireducens]|uniref:2-oxoglutarate ferredoxin oxidoreductase, gamma subunit n=1 Tax=Garciella nitratireducens DSM 15102 TaxID=1121911 RepID=A0A1T4JV51_9FIRM|nr:2-oxoacid:acceptor oxidoreductase family protein [Garciella nitratireducens]RBP45593.1 2-oxoglutarate ferredoxin oxidoreductase gamma subunit [Garciella nitratireducens]SJZ34031.1 2-oxoglutarate ferredoxin oxidoreductase, gamma subunit [Garciella nitratireducens DSM 15102]
MGYKEIRLSGSGGQGIILMGIILAEAALMSNINAIQSQSYGPEARGGASKCEVILSENEIDFPKVRKPDILLSLTQDAFNKYKIDVKSNGIVIVDSKIEVPKDVKFEVYKAPILSTVHEVLKKPMVINIVALGVLNKITHLIDNDILKKAILKRVPKGTEDLNKKAFEMGNNLL